MERQKIAIGQPLYIPVNWYDNVRDIPTGLDTYEGEVVGWRQSQVIVRVKGYAVVRFWKKSGLEVGNADHQRRGFRIDLEALAESTKPAPGVEVTLDGQMPVVPENPQ
jgi:hypothetical protein